jgi:hypothetical protein
VKAASGQYIFLLAGKSDQEFYKKSIRMADDGSNEQWLV